MFVFACVCVCVCCRTPPDVARWSLAGPRAAFGVGAGSARPRATTPPRPHPLPPAGAGFTRPRCCSAPAPITVCAPSRRRGAGRRSAFRCPFRSSLPAALAAGPKLARRFSCAHPRPPDPRAFPALSPAFFPALFRRGPRLTAGAAAERPASTPAAAAAAGKSATTPRGPADAPKSSAVRAPSLSLDVHGRMDESMDGWMDGCMNGRMDDWMDGWIGGWMDGCMSRWAMGG